jgi:hypothetical protein
VTDIGYLQDHADAVLDLLRSVPALAVYEESDGGPTTVPPGVDPPYVTVHMVSARTIGPDLTMRSTRMSVRIYTHSVGLNDVAARAVSDLVAEALLDQKPYIDGRVVFPIRQEVGNDPREDESAGYLTSTITETWRLDTLPGSSSS